MSFSYGAHLTHRDNGKMMRLVTSQRYRDLWGDGFGMLKVGEQKIENDQTGWKFATSIGGIGTGERGDRVLLDDPHNVVQQDSEGVRADTVRFFRESMSNRGIGPGMAYDLQWQMVRRIAGWIEREQSKPRPNQRQLETLCDRMSRVLEKLFSAARP